MWNVERSGVRGGEGTWVAVGKGGLREQLGAVREEGVKEGISDCHGGHQDIMA